MSQPQLLLLHHLQLAPLLACSAPYRSSYGRSFPAAPPTASPPRPPSHHVDCGRLALRPQPQLLPLRHLQLPPLLTQHPTVHCSRHTLTGVDKFTANSYAETTSTSMAPSAAPSAACAAARLLGVLPQLLRLLLPGCIAYSLPATAPVAPCWLWQACTAASTAALTTVSTVASSAACTATLHPQPLPLLPRGCTAYKPPLSLLT